MLVSVVVTMVMTLVIVLMSLVSLSAYWVAELLDCCLENLLRSLG